MAATFRTTGRPARARITLLLMSLWLAPAPAHAGDVAADWNAVMLTAVAPQNPFAQARIAAIAQLAVFDAVNAITGGYAPYLDGIEVPAGASEDAAAVAAAHRVLRHYLPASSAMLDAARTTSLAAIPDGAPKDDGLAVGEAIADALIALRAADGSASPAFHLPGSDEPGIWQVTPGCPAAGGILLHWGRVTPFVLRGADQFRSDPPSLPTSERYARDYNEVLEVGDASSGQRPPDRTDVARFYAAVLAVHTWNPVALQLADAHGASLTERARLLALLNVAISDALVSVMETKYHYTFWRPLTAARHADTDGNSATLRDDAFTPLVATPCFPSYPSAHASASYAAREVLERVFGRGPHAVSLSNPAVPDLRFDYTSLEQITDDIDDARVYGGIHFRFDQEAGARQGRQVGHFVWTHTLRSVRGR